MKKVDKHLKILGKVIDYLCSAELAKICNELECHAIADSYKNLNMVYNSLHRYKVKNDRHS